MSTMNTRTLDLDTKIWLNGWGCDDCGRVDGTVRITGQRADRRHMRYLVHE